MGGGAVTERQQAIVEGLFADMDASSDAPKEAGSIVTAVGLSQREAARALRNAGVTNPVVTNWLNDWALQCWEAQGRNGPTEGNDTAGRGSGRCGNRDR